MLPFILGVGTGILIDNLFNSKKSNKKSQKYNVLEQKENKIIISSNNKKNEDTKYRKHKKLK